jgi:hypothetical protein
VMADFRQIEINDASREIDDASHSGKWGWHGRRQRRQDGRVDGARFGKDLQCLCAHSFV